MSRETCICETPTRWEISRWVMSVLEAQPKDRSFAFRERCEQPVEVRGVLDVLVAVVFGGDRLDQGQVAVIGERDVERDGAMGGPELPGFQDALGVGVEAPREFLDRGWAAGLVEFVGGVDLRGEILQ